MKNILFINMPIREIALPNNVPLGIILLATILKNLGYEIDILDLNVFRPFPSDDQIEKMLITILNNKPFDTVCLSGLITTIKNVERVSKLIKRLCPRIFLIVGGGLATDIGEQLKMWIPEIDKVIVGPGEMVLQKSIENPNDDLCIGFLPSNIDDFKFDYSVMDVESYLFNPIWGSKSGNSSKTPFSMKRSLNGITSRGCMFKCAFCSHLGLGNKIYYRGAKILADETQHLVNTYDIDFWGAVDDNACTNKKRLLKFANLKKNDLRWGTHARLDDLADIERVAILAESNCIYLGCGGESASLNILKRMNKGRKVINSPIFEYNGFEFPQIYIDALENCKRFGIHPNLTWISNYPREILSDLQTTVAFILFMQDEDYVEKRYNNRSLFVATAYPNTQFFNEPVVQSKLNLAFGSLRDYVYSLGDATKTIQNNNVLLNYSDISDEDFLLVREYIASDRIEKILDMQA